MQAELVPVCRNQHGESGHLGMPDRVCCFAPRKDGGFILAYADWVALTDEAAREVKNLTRFEPDNPDARLNAGPTIRNLGRN